MKKLLIVLALFIPVWCFAAPCPVTVGTLTLNLTQPRTSCVSPCLLFFDTTGSADHFQGAAHTTDTATLGGQNNVVQDVFYAWSFGDPNASGTGTWANGSRPNVNSKNQATGPVAAHLYVLPTNGTTDLTTSGQVWAYDGTNIATCTFSVTIFAPSGTNGFSGTNTICAFNSAVGSGCPAGAATVTASTLGAATASLTSGKRVLLKCGDTFSGGISIASTVNKASLGAYGGCENTTTGRPILTNTSGNTFNITGTSSGGATDVRFADLDLEDGTFGSTSFNIGYQNTATYATQITLYNVNCNNVQNCTKSEMTQSGVIASAAHAHNYVFYINTGQGQCINGYNQAGGTWDGTWCGTTGGYSQSLYANISYDAFIGNLTDGSGTNTASENTRVGACRMCVFENNTFTGQETNTGNSLLKMHNANNFSSSTTWIGQWAEVNEISDNFFTNGPANGFDSGYCAQNQTYDERMRYGILERNLYDLINTETGATTICATLTTDRDDVVYSNVVSNAVFAPEIGFFFTKQAGQNAATFGNLEVYNNTCYAPTTAGRFTSNCIQVDNNSSSIMQNNLFFNAGSSTTVVSGTTGNTVSNNSPNSTTNFSPGNPSGTFRNITDFKPASPVSGALSTVPNYFDATGLSWIGAFSLGALSKAAGAP